MIIVDNDLMWRTFQEVEPMHETVYDNQKLLVMNLLIIDRLNSCDDQKQNPLNKMPSQNVHIEHLRFLRVFWGDKLLRHQSTLVILPNECAYHFKTQVL